jgi:hypothetical protein
MINPCHLSIPSPKSEHRFLFTTSGYTTIEQYPNVARREASNEIGEGIV